MAKKPVKVAPKSDPPEKFEDSKNHVPASRKLAREEDRVYCAYPDCGKKLESGRKYYCNCHDSVWPD